MRHLVRAVALEYGKLGRLTLEADFEHFHELIRPVAAAYSCKKPELGEAGQRARRATAGRADRGNASRIAVAVARPVEQPQQVGRSARP